MSGKREKIDFRRQVVRAADESNVQTNDYERAIILGQIASLLATHPRIAGKIAFKGGAIMTLIDKSPRLSRDLDGAMVAGGRIDEQTIRDALTDTPEARRIVKRVDRFATTGKTGLRFPVIVCHPLSGKGEVTVMLSVNWSEPLLLKPETKVVTILGRKVSLPVVARIERVSEKVRAFIDRGEDRDGFDLYYFSSHGLSAREWSRLGGLVERKIQADDELPPGTDLHGLFDEHMETLASSWAQRGGLTVMRSVPPWDDVRPHVEKFRTYLPVRQP